jgi:hypothetical protein
MDGYAVTNALLDIFERVIDLTRDTRKQSIATTHRGPKVFAHDEHAPDDSRSRWIDCTLRDLQSSEYIIAETLLLLNKLHGQTPLSAIGLLGRCRTIWNALDPMLKRALEVSDQSTRAENGTENRQMPFPDGVRSPHLSASDPPLSIYRSKTGRHQEVEEGQRIEHLARELQATAMDFQQTSNL